VEEGAENKKVGKQNKETVSIVRPSRSHPRPRPVASSPLPLGLTKWRPAVLIRKVSPGGKRWWGGGGGDNIKEVDLQHGHDSDAGDRRDR
jgi:hypothetical protein